MKKSGSIFPERIDSYSQLPLLQEHSIHAIASNSLRSAILKIEETIGEKVLDSKIFKKFSSIKERFDLIENNIIKSNAIKLPFGLECENYEVLKLTESGWKKRAGEEDILQLGIVLEESIIINGFIWMESNPEATVGSKITILNEKIVQSNDLLYIGTIVAKNNNLAQILLRNTWTT